MKNVLLFICLILGFYQAKAQIIITGFYTEPPHDDAPATGGFEYMQFMATENIDFSTNNYCVVVAGNGGQLVTANGWAGPIASTNHYKFNLTTGSVAKGEFFYVGNIMKQINGTLNGTPSTDISETAAIATNRAKWIRTINTGAVNGDDDIGKAAIAGFLSQAQTSACGIAVFSGITVTATTVPLDAVFYGTSIGQSNYVAPDKGYLIPVNNGFYNDGGGTQKYFGQGTNTTLVGPRSTSNDNQFYMMGGTYNTSTKVWTNRAGTRVKLTATSTLADIQTGANITTLPVEMVSFTGKNQNNGIQLNWITASEKNNNRFDILRSSDGFTFNTIGTLAGAGNSDAINTYSFTDAYPLPGVNYYQLNQIDHNGISEKSKVITVTTNLQEEQFKIIQTEDQTIATIYATELAKGQIKITDMTGRELFNATILLGKGHNQFKIPTSAIQQGIYIASLLINHQNTSSVKFVK